VIPPAALPRWAAAGQLRPVPDSYQAETLGYGWKRLLPIYRDRLLLWDRQPYALPLVGEAPLCFYRTDLFGSPEHREAFRKEHGRELSAPTTWEEFADTAEFFAKRLDRPSLPPLPEADADLDRLLFSVAAPFARKVVVRDKDPDAPTDVETFSFHYDLKTGEPRLETPGFVHALELLLRLQACRPAGTLPAPPEAFRDGKAVLCLADASWIARFQGGKVGRDFGVCPVPGSRSFFAYHSGEAKPAGEVNRVPYLGAGGWLGVVPVESKHPDSAFALLAELSSPETSRQVVLSPQLGAGGAYRIDHLDRPAGWYLFDLSAADTNELLASLRQTLLHTGVRNPLLRLRTPDEREHRQALLEEVRAALRTEKSPADALAAATRRWRQLDAGKPEKVRKTEYLHSLSLHGER
jgi:ABC-type glycerol-3-phosphate transport system substrate-binding protein